MRVLYLPYHGLFVFMSEGTIEVNSEDFIDPFGLELYYAIDSTEIGIVMHTARHNSMSQWRRNLSGLADPCSRVWILFE